MEKTKKKLPGGVVARTAVVSLKQEAGGVRLPLLGRAKSYDSVRVMSCCGIWRGVAETAVCTAMVAYIQYPAHLQVLLGFCFSAKRERERERWLTLPFLSLKTFLCVWVSCV